MNLGSYFVLTATCLFLHACGEEHADPVAATGHLVRVIDARTQEPLGPCTIVVVRDTFGSFGPEKRDEDISRWFRGRGQKFSVPQSGIVRMPRLTNDCRIAAFTDDMFCWRPLFSPPRGDFTLSAMPVVKVSVRVKDQFGNPVVGVKVGHGTGTRRSGFLHVRDSASTGAKGEAQLLLSRSRSDFNDNDWSIRFVGIAGFRSEPAVRVFPDSKLPNGPIELVMEKPAILTVRVLMPDGTPCPSGKLWAKISGDKGERAWSFDNWSDISGENAIFLRLQPGSKLKLTAIGPKNSGWAEVTSNVEVGAKAADLGLIELKFEKRAILQTGRVHDEKGVPLVGRRLSITNASQWGVGYDYDYRVVSQFGGRFDLFRLMSNATNVPHGISGVKVVDLENGRIGAPSAEGSSSYYFQDSDVADLGAMKLKYPSFVANGTVVDRRGKPIPFVFPKINPSFSTDKLPNFKIENCSSLIGPDLFGRFVLYGELSTEPFFVLFEVKDVVGVAAYSEIEGLSYMKKTVLIEPGQKDIVVVLEDAGVVRGRLSNRPKVPLSCHLDLPGGKESLSGTIKLDGRFEFREVPFGVYSLAICSGDNRKRTLHRVPDVEVPDRMIVNLGSIDVGK